jgi:large subunit ribosomal protein L10
MNRDQKAAVIEQIAADITASQAVFAIDYRGITVAQADALRARLRDCDATFRVVKNSLTDRAAEAAGAGELRPLLEGPTALTFVRGDAAAAAKAISDFARTTQLLAFKGGLMDGAVLSAGEITSISRLPSRDVLYGQLVGLVANPITSLARTLNALIAGIAVQLGGVLAQREAAGETVTAPEPAATAAASDPGADAEPAAEAATAEPPVTEPAAEADTEEPAAEAVLEEESPSEPTAEPGTPEASEVQTDEAPATTAPEEESSGEPAPEPSGPEASTDEASSDEASSDEHAHQSEDAPADASTPDTN